MGQTDKIVAVIALIGSLILVASGTRFQRMSSGKTARLGLIWAAIFIALIALAKAGG